MTSMEPQTHLGIAGFNHNAIRSVPKVCIPTTIILSLCYLPRTDKGLGYKIQLRSKDVAAQGGKRAKRPVQIQYVLEKDDMTK